jgi:transcription elongation factor GreB
VGATKDSQQPAAACAERVWTRKRAATDRIPSRAAVAVHGPGSQGLWRAKRDTLLLEQAVNKAFVKEPPGAEDDDDSDGGGSLPALPPGTRNYITPAGYRRLRSELMQLLDSERPKVVEAVSWAAKNGDRSENGDYLYGKKRLREIDRRIRFLSKRLDIAEVADPSVHQGKDQVFFGATVTYANAQGEERCITIKGIDEADSLAGEVSWISPIARALLRAREGDTVPLMTPAGAQTLEVLKVDYPPPAAAAA